MKKIVTNKYISNEIGQLINLGNSKIERISAIVSQRHDISDKSIKAERIEIVTENKTYFLYSTASQQHWYGDGEIEILNEPYPDDNEEFNTKNYSSIELTDLIEWKEMVSRVVAIKVYSVGKKAFQLLRLRNEKTYNQATYVELKFDNGKYLSIGFHGHNQAEKKALFLNFYSWSGELIMNYNHCIKKDELTEWDLKEIFNKSW